MTLKSDLIHAATQFDRKQSTKRGYNIYALGLSFKRIDQCLERIDAGSDPFQTICDGFNGPMLLAIGKVIRPKLTRADVIEIDRNRTRVTF